MITAKQAVEFATNYMVGIYGTLEGLLVEELELDAQEGVWIVTMGFWLALPPQSESLTAMAKAFGEPRRVRRAYKEIRMRAADGEVLSMKIRTIPAVDVK